MVGEPRRSIVLKDGTRLATLSDVRTFILKQPDHIQERGSGQHAAETYDPRCRARREH
jgi:hypothetical protein